MHDENESRKCVGQSAVTAGPPSIRQDNQQDTLDPLSTVDRLEITIKKLFSSVHPTSGHVEAISEKDLLALKKRLSTTMHVLNGCCLWYSRERNQFFYRLRDETTWKPICTANRCCKPAVDELTFCSIHEPLDRVVNPRQRSTTAARGRKRRQLSQESDSSSQMRRPRFGRVNEDGSIGMTTRAGKKRKTAELATKEPQSGTDSSAERVHPSSQVEIDTSVDIQKVDRIPCCSKSVRKLQPVPPPMDIDSQGGRSSVESSSLEFISLADKSSEEQSSIEFFNMASQASVVASAEGQRPNDSVGESPEEMNESHSYHDSCDSSGMLEHEPGTDSSAECVQPSSQMDTSMKGEIQHDGELGSSGRSKDNQQVDSVPCCSKSVRELLPVQPPMDADSQMGHSSTEPSTVDYSSPSCKSSDEVSSVEYTGLASQTSVVTSGVANGQRHNEPVGEISETMNDSYSDPTTWGYNVTYF